MKLFSSDGRYTASGLALNAEIIKALTPIFTSYLEAGAHVRHVGAIVAHSILDIEGEMILDGRTKATTGFESEDQS